jgi:transposase
VTDTPPVYEGYHVRLANTTAIQQYNGLKHTNDKTDARWLAELNRLNILPEGYIYPKDERGIRDLLRKRMQLLQQQTLNILSMQTIIERSTSKRISGNMMHKITMTLRQSCVALPQDHLAFISAPLFYI